eukprot:1133228-Pyramimonas_sp.AAC.1
MLSGGYCHVSLEQIRHHGAGRRCRATARRPLVNMIRPRCALGPVSSDVDPWSVESFTAGGSPAGGVQRPPAGDRAAVRIRSRRPTAYGESMMLCMLRAIGWMLRAVGWMLRAVGWMLRAVGWMLRAMVLMLRAMPWMLGLRCSGLRRVSAQTRVRLPGID